jgi:hypothetical protein
MAPLSTSLEGLQRQVDALKQDSYIWNLDISLAKTVVMQPSGEPLEEDLPARDEERGFGDDAASLY